MQILKKRGRKPGAVSFTYVTLSELNRVLKDGAIVVIGKKFADINHLQVLNINGSATTMRDVSVPAPSIKIYTGLD